MNEPRHTARKYNEKVHGITHRYNGPKTGTRSRIRKDRDARAAGRLSKGLESLGNVLRAPRAGVVKRFVNFITQRGNR